MRLRDLSQGTAAQPKVIMDQWRTVILCIVFSACLPPLGLRSLTETKWFRGKCILSSVGQCLSATYDLWCAKNRQVHSSGQGPLQVEFRVFWTSLTSCDSNSPQFFQGAILVPRCPAVFQILKYMTMMTFT